MGGLTGFLGTDKRQKRAWGPPGRPSLPHLWGRSGWASTRSGDVVARQALGLEGSVLPVHRLLGSIPVGWCQGS